MKYDIMSILLLIILLCLGSGFFFGRLSTNFVLTPAIDKLLKRKARADERENQ